MTRLSPEPQGLCNSEGHLEGITFSNFHEGASGLARGPGLGQWMTDPHVPAKTRAKNKDAPLQEPHWLSELPAGRTWPNDLCLLRRTGTGFRPCSGGGCSRRLLGSEGRGRQRTPRPQNSSSEIFRTSRTRVLAVGLSHCINIHQASQSIYREAWKFCGELCTKLD